MRTEEAIVYDLLNIIYGGRISDDNVVSERLVRSFLRKHRASKLNSFFNNGATLNDYVFQELGELELNQISENEFSVELPALINFEENFGIKLHKNRLNIPLLHEESYHLSLSNPINKSFPKAKQEGSVLTVFTGLNNLCDFCPESPKEIVVNKFKEETNSSKIYVNTKAVLYDPSDAINYDWTKSNYPCPSEIIDQIKTSTLARDFELLIRVKPDQFDNKSEIDKY